MHISQIHEDHALQEQDPGSLFLLLSAYVSFLVNISVLGQGCDCMLEQLKLSCPLWWEVGITTEPFLQCYMYFLPDPKPEAGTHPQHLLRNNQHPNVSTPYYVHAHLEGLMIIQLVKPF